jgi:hypothetical protein
LARLHHSGGRAVRKEPFHGHRVSRWLHFLIMIMSRIMIFAGKIPVSRKSHFDGTP